MKILIVDDDEDVRTILRLMFRRGDHEVLEAGDGTEAVLRAATELPDVIVLDIMLPAIDGYATLEALRSMRGTRSIPVVVLSARALREDIARAYEVGADDYVTKPFTPDELTVVVEAIAEAGRAPHPSVHW